MCGKREFPWECGHGNLKLARNGNAIGNGNHDVGIGNESVPKITINDRIKFSLKLQSAF